VLLNTVTADYYTQNIYEFPKRFGTEPKSLSVGTQKQLHIQNITLTSSSSSLHQNWSYRCSQYACPLYSDLHLQILNRPTAAAASGNTYRRSTLAIACSPLDAGETEIMIVRHDKTNSGFSGHRTPATEQKLKKHTKVNRSINQSIL